MKTITIDVFYFIMKSLMMSFYYFNEAGELVASNENNWLPFVDIINTVARRSDGSSIESPQKPPNGRNFHEFHLN